DLWLANADARPGGRGCWRRVGGAGAAQLSVAGGALLPDSREDRVGTAVFSSRHRGGRADYAAFHAAFAAGYPSNKAESHPATGNGGATAGLAHLAQAIARIRVDWGAVAGGAGRHRGMAEQFVAAGWLFWGRGCGEHGGIERN